VAQTVAALSVLDNQEFCFPPERSAGLDEQDVKKLLQQAEQMISKRDKDADG
jgi:hypothetical protein